MQPSPLHFCLCWPKASGRWVTAQVETSAALWTARPGSFVSRFLNWHGAVLKFGIAEPVTVSLLDMIILGFGMPSSRCQVHGRFLFQRDLLMRRIWSCQFWERVSLAIDLRSMVAQDCCWRHMPQGQIRWPMGFFSFFTTAGTASANTIGTRLEASLAESGAFLLPRKG